MARVDESELRRDADGAVRGKENGLAEARGLGDDESPVSSEPRPSNAPDGATELLLWRVGGLVRTMRPHQWVKNVFVLAPLVFAKEIFVPELLLRAIGAFGVFCLLASAVYTMNDIADRESDRSHPIKRHRPIPSGRVPPAWARAFTVLLVAVTLAGAALGSLAFFVTVLSYFVLNVAYSFRLKQYAYVDVAIIAAGFVLRVMAGGFATHIDVSWYLLACTALLALFLGLGKRRHELAAIQSGTTSRQRAALDDYSQRGLDRTLRVTALCTVATYVAYTLDANTVAFFRSERLWWTSIFVVLGMLRFLHLVRGRPKAESPTQEILRDGPFVAILFSWIAVVMWIVYSLRPGQ
jgi:decaprenyl-phosphate phosphoribosyltransferase